MKNSRSPREAIETVIRTIQNYLNIGVCQKCALRLAAQLYNMDLNQVEDTWINYQVNQLDKEI